MCVYTHTHTQVHTHTYIRTTQWRGTRKTEYITGSLFFMWIWRKFYGWSHGEHREGWWESWICEEAQREAVINLAYTAHKPALLLNSGWPHLRNLWLCLFTLLVTFVFSISFSVLDSHLCVYVFFNMYCFLSWWLSLFLHIHYLSFFSLRSIFIHSLPFTTNIIMFSPIKDSSRKLQLQTFL